MNETEGKSEILTAGESVLEGELKRPVMAAGSAIIIFLTAGTLVYHALEPWSWIECVYFCVNSLTTVGYGDFTPSSDVSRLFTIVYLLTGTGAVVASVGVIGSRYLELRDRKIRQRESRKRDAR